jgi:hypothetical protein
MRYSPHTQRYTSTAHTRLKSKPAIYSSTRNYLLFPLRLAMHASASELACLEDLLKLILDQTPCPVEKDVFKHLWKIYMQEPIAEDPKRYEEMRGETRAALQLLTYSIKGPNNVLEGMKPALMEHTLKVVQYADVDWLLFRDELSAFQRIVGDLQKEDVVFLNNAIMALIKYRHSPRKMEWFCGAQELINALFALLDYPEPHTEYLIHELNKAFLRGDMAVSSGEEEIKRDNITRNRNLDCHCM